jgi:hypothetical protein
MKCFVRVQRVVSVVMLIGITMSFAGCGGDDDPAAQQTPAPTSPLPGPGTGSALLTWYPPTQNSDGSALTNLAGYKVYWGTSPTNLSNSVTLTNPGLSSYLVEQLTPATWHFALTAVNSAGVESARSNVASKQIL